MYLKLACMFQKKRTGNAMIRNWIANTLIKQWHPLTSHLRRHSTGSIAAEILKTIIKKY